MTGEQVKSLSIVTALGGIPRFHKATLIPQTVDLLAAEDHERGKTVILSRPRNYADWHGRPAVGLSTWWAPSGGAGAGVSA